MNFSDEILQKFQVIFALLQKKNLFIAIAESCTGGLLSALFTEKAGSSKIFDRGFVVYSNQSKIDMLEVKKELIDSYGAVSHEVALAMAKGVLKKSHSDISIAITGIAGPDGGSIEKPVGTIFIAIANDKNFLCEKFNFGNCRQINRQKTLESSLDLLNFFLENKL